jgi:hypothetical protein
MNGYRRTAATDAASTGNDLVALMATRPERTCLPRFYGRILTAAEQQGFHSLEPAGLPFDQYVWLCWSVKEAVYKYKKRQSPDLRFSPLQIETHSFTLPFGSARFFECIVEGPIAVPGTLYSRSLIRDGVIVTTVSEDAEFTGVHWGFSAIDSVAYADQSSSVRMLALERLKSVLSRDDLELQKDDADCPIVLAGGEVLPIPVSLAHHEGHIAYSFRYIDLASPTAEGPAEEAAEGLLK